MAYPGYGAPPPGGYGGYPPPPGGAYGGGGGAPPPGGAYGGGYGGAYGGAPPPASAAQYSTMPAAGGAYGSPSYPPPASYGAPPPGAAAAYASAAAYPQYGGGPPAGYGAPGAGYGAPPPGAGYGAPPPGAGYGAPPPGAGYGAPPPGAGYGAPPPGAGYGAPPPGAGYGAPPPAAGAYASSASYSGGMSATNSPGTLAPADSKWPRPPRIATGNRKALLIGINYIGHSQGRLNGCINDVKNVYQFLTIGAGFNPANIRVLTDDQTDPSKMPNRANIEAGMKWLAEGAAPGDSLFFHYSGHGGQERDPTFLEDDGMNETICPCDYQTAGQIIDDKIHAYLAKPLPAGCRLTAVFDSCHSGTVMDLPYMYKSHDPRYKHAHRADDDTFMQRHKKTGFKGSVTSMLLNHVGGEVAFNVKRTARQKIIEKLNTTKADVIQISGCRDEQTSADATLGGQATGAMSWSLMEALRHDPNVTYEQLITNMRDLLKDGPTQFRQVPQVSYGNPHTDMTELFTL